MFGIVVLLKTISVRKSLSNERQERVAKDAVDVKLSPHDSSEDQDRCCTALWYTGPHMHLVRMLHFRLQFRRHTFLPKAKPSVTLNPYTGLISEDDIVKGVADLHAPFTESQPGDTIRLSYDLAILWASFLPSQSLPGCLHSGNGQLNPTFRE